MKQNCYVKNDILYYPSGKVNCKPEDNIDLSRGLFEGVGYSLTMPEKKLIRKYINWNTLNSHKLTIGTTRQGKSRKMISDVEQQIARGANVFIGEPKGSAFQEIIAYTIQSLLKYNRVGDFIYLSPLHKQFSIRFNPLYRKRNTEISSLLGEIVESKEAVYKNIGRALGLAIVLGTDFIERFDAIENPYDKIIMERFEFSKIQTDSVNSLNKFIWQSHYNEKEFGVDIDVIGDLIEKASPYQKKLILEAERRVLDRYNPTKSIHDGVIPLRTFLTFKDIAQFESPEAIAKLFYEVGKRYELLKNMNNVPESLKILGSEAMLELEKRSKDDPTFIKKLGTSFSMALTDLITDDVGELLNTCRINPLLDALTSDSRGAVIVYQPFPLVYPSASVALGRILFSMFSSMSGYIGASGVLLKRRLYINIDEAGAILSPIVQELSNKGGGLGFSLCLYTQSIADIVKSLEETGCRIILDNMNTKEFFKVNDNTTAQEIATIMGTIRSASLSTGSTSKRDSKVSASVEEKDIANTSIVQRLNERSYLLKEGSDVYIMAAPHVEDTIFKIVMPIPSYAELARIDEEKMKNIKESMR